MNRTKQMQLAQLANNPTELTKELYAIANDKSEGVSWKKESLKLAMWLDSGMKAEPIYKVFSKGNMKIPFKEFSTLPIVTCPGFGDCGNINFKLGTNEKYELKNIPCYSFKCWRYASPFFRQLQNTVLMLGQSEHITKAWHAIGENETIRLYCNGDIDSMKTLEFWIDRLRERPDIQAYGYSKSWALFLSYKGEWPKNYFLNLSSGSRYDDTTRQKMEALPIVRGEFIALEVPHKLKGKYDNPEYKQELRKVAKLQGIEKPFLCSGKCGDCTKKGPACALDTFAKIPIVIGIH